MRDDDDRVDLAVRELVPDVPPMSEESFAAGRDRVLAGAASSTGRYRRLAASRPGRRPRQRGQWIGVAAAVAAVVAVVGGTVAVFDFGGSDVTVNAADRPVGPGQYRYVKKTMSDWLPLFDHPDRSVDCLFRYEQTEETWIPADWNQEWLRRTSNTGPLEARPCSLDEAARYHSLEVTPWESRAQQGKFKQSPGVGLFSDVEEGPDDPPDIRHPTPEFLAGVPRDPQKLFELLRDSTCGQDFCALEGAVDMLDTGQVPSDLRTAVYRALTRGPGMTVVEDQANLDGRVGIAIRTSYYGWDRDMIFDPETGDYIGIRFVEGSDVGDTLQFSAVTTGVADAIGEPPTE
jgi:hypothetical protein